MAAQNLDSLEKVYTDKNGLLNIDSFLVKAKMILYSAPDKAFEMSVKAIEASKKQNKPVKLANSYRLQGAYYSDIKGDYILAAKLYNLADSIYRKNKGIEAAEGVGAIYHCYGTIEQRKGNYLQAIDNYTKALKIFDSLQNKTTRPKTLNNLSTLYSFYKDYPKAEEYARECLKISEENNDNYLISVASVTLASALISEEKYDEIPNYLNKALQIAKQRNDAYISGLVYQNLGSYHYFKKDYKRAITEIQQSLQYAEVLGNEAEKMRGLVDIAEAYYKEKDYINAQKKAEQALELEKKFNNIDFEQRTLALLSDIEAYNKNFSKSHDYLSLAYSLQDSVFNENKERQINYLEYVYQTKQKELEISALKKEKKFYTILAISGLLLLLLFILILYLKQKNANHKKQIAENKIIQLEQEKNLVATQSLLEGETVERTRLAKDLHDGLGGILSALKINLYDMKTGMNMEANDVVHFNKALDLLETSTLELRRVSHNLMPESLSLFGLKAALTDYCNSFENKVKFHFFGEDKRLEKITESSVYRITQELVNNAIKYAQAKQINVQLILEENLVNISVQDDGIGFDISKVDLTKTNGLKNIYDRVYALKNGKIDFDSAENKGTEITITFNI